MRREPRTGDVPKGYLRKRASGADKIDYNVNKLATKAFSLPKPAKVPKAKKTATKKKSTKKVSATYSTLIKRALKKLLPKAEHAGVSIPAIVKFLFKYVHLVFLVIPHVWTIYIIFSIPGISLRSLIASMFAGHLLRVLQTRALFRHV